jgi:hypothetical protein
VVAAKLAAVAKNGGGAKGLEMAEVEARAAKIMLATTKNQLKDKQSKRDKVGNPLDGGASSYSSSSSVDLASMFPVEYDVGRDEVGDGTLDDPRENERRARAARQVRRWLVGLDE